MSSSLWLPIYPLRNPVAALCKDSCVVYILEEVGLDIHTLFVALRINGNLWNHNWNKASTNYKSISTICSAYPNGTQKRPAQKSDQVTNQETQAVGTVYNDGDHREHIKLTAYS